MSDQEKPEPAQKLKSFSELIPLSPVERNMHQLQILEALMSQAVRDKDWPNALKIFNEAHNMLKKIPQK
jgi:hypothetical protein